jgi:hypothetical protein
MAESDIDSLKAYEMLLTPLYVRLEKNKKLLAIKSSIELLMPEEIEKFKAFKKVFIPKQAVFELEKYKKLAEVIFSILNTQETVSVGASTVNIDMHPSERSAYIRIELQEFFRNENSIIPEGLVLLVNLLISPVSYTDIEEIYLKNIDEFKARYVYSSIKTLEHLIYGYANIDFLKNNRMKWFIDPVIKTNESNQVLFSLLLKRLNEWGGMT